MAARGFILIAAALASVGGCKGRDKNDDVSITANIGEDAAAPSGSQNGSEDGKVSINVPGFQMKVSIPKAARDATVSGSSDILYPGSSVSGVNVQAKADEEGGKGTVQLRFASPVAPDKLAAWYRDRARAPQIEVTSVTSSGTGFVVNGTKKDGDAHFTIKFDPSGTGSGGELTITGS